MALDLTYLKKRAALVDDIKDDKVQNALRKIMPKKIDVPDVSMIETGDYYDAVVKNKMMRHWIDLVTEKDRGFIRFVYVDGNDNDILKYIKTAMTKSAWKNFSSLISKDPTDSDLSLMRYVIWNYIIKDHPVGVDFGNFEMNQIVNALPMDIAKDKAVFDAKSLPDFYKMIYYAKWILNYAG